MSKELEYPGQIDSLALGLLAGCLFVAVGLFNEFGGWLSLLGFSFTFYVVLWAIADFLPVRRHGAAVVLRTVGFFTALGVLASFVIATIVFNL